MRLLNKIKFHPLTLFFTCIALVSGYFKYMILVVIVIFVHEMGHIVVAKMLKRKILSIEILPFGGLVKMDSIVSSNIMEDLLIAVAGIGSQTILGFVLLWFKCIGLCENHIFNIINTYNIAIIVFNMLPICPLDGYKINKCIWELGIPFKATFAVAIFISIVSLLAIIFYDYRVVLNNPFVFLFLLYSIIFEIVNRRFWLMRFYIERLNRDFYYPKVKISKIENMYKNKIHIIDGVDEKKFLARLFTSKRD